MLLRITPPGIDVRVKYCALRAAWRNKGFINLCRFFYFLSVITVPGWSHRAVFDIYSTFCAALMNKCIVITLPWFTSHARERVRLPFPDRPVFDTPCVGRAAWGDVAIIKIALFVYFLSISAIPAWTHWTFLAISNAFFAPRVDETRIIACYGWIRCMY